MPNAIVISGDTIGATTPNAPSGLTATASFDGVSLNWTNPTNTTIDYIQIVSGNVNNRANSYVTTLANIKSTAFYDHTTTAETKYYWVRAVPTVGNASSYNTGATSGTSATPQEVTITTPVMGQTLYYDGDNWVNSANIAQNVSGNAATTITRITTSTSAQRTAFRVKKTVNLSRAQGDGPIQVFSYEGTDGGYDHLGIRAGYDTGGDHSIVAFNSTATDNSLSPSQAIFTANAAQMSIAGTLTIDQAANTAMPTGRPGALCTVSNNSYKLAYYNGSSWRYVADDSAV